VGFKPTISAGERPAGVVR